MSEQDNSLSELVQAVKELTQAQMALTKAINRQADAIADLVNSAFDHDDDDDEGGDTYL